MAAIKIKAASKSSSTDAPPAAEAAPKSPTASISSGDDAAPASSNANDRDDNSSSNVDGSSNGESFVGNEDGMANGDAKKASSAKAGGGEEDATMEEDANHDSNDAVGEDGNGNPTASGNDKKENQDEGNDDEMEDSSPDAEDANASGKDGQEEDANDAEENKEEDGKDDDDDDDEDEEEMWELKKILTVEEISTRNFMCNGVGCPNVACSVYQSTHDTNCVNAWFSCLDCQELDYGGWPETKAEIPMTFMTKQHRETIRQYCTRNAANAVFPDLPTSRNGEDEDKSDDDEAEDKWDLIEVITVKDLKKKKPKRCQDDGCSSAACSVWVSNAAPDDEWYGCIDCMESYYGGWPSSDEMPVKHLTEEHRALLAEKCSTKENPPMPDLPTSMPSLLATAGGNDTANITPIPSHEQAVADNQSNLVVGAFRSKGKKSGVTPSPMPPKGASKQAGKKAPLPKIDPKLKAMYAKWQAEAEKMGETTIIIDTNQAKKVVFDKLHDLFSPVNITQLHQKLKGLVPQPILRKCLDKMVDKSNDNPFADDSDDEDEKLSKKKSASKSSSDEYAGSIRVKEGRNSNNTLYYVDHSKLQNNGNGLLPEARNELFSNLELSKQELAALGQKHKQISSDIAQLLSEPKNEELETELQELTNKIEILDNGLEEARAHASNAQRAKQLKSRTAKMSSEWRKRKRYCNEFIMNMEEATDGTISMKKCCKGDGPIDIETDEGAIKGAKEYALKRSKRPKVISRGGLKQRNGMASNTGSQPDDRFIGVLLDSKGFVQRVYNDEEN